MLNETQNVKWPDLSKNQRAAELAKTAIGWADMTAEQQMDNLQAMIVRAAEIEKTL